MSTARLVDSLAVAQGDITMFNSEGYKMTERETQLQDYVNGLNLVLEQVIIDQAKADPYTYADDDKAYRNS